MLYVYIEEIIVKRHEKNVRGDGVQGLSSVFAPRVEREKLGHSSGLVGEGAGPAGLAT